VRLTALGAAIVLALATATGAQPIDVKAQIGQLAALDYPVRMNAALALRRVPAAEVVPALTEAIRSHPDQFVRYRALVLLTSFNDRGTGELIRSLLTDKNDRLREVAYKWLEQHPDPAMRFALLSALQTEQAEFVRPALVGALAALGDDPDVRRALIGEVTRGLDFFRSAVIDELGHHRAAYAVEAIGGVALNDGPLQADAILALGRIGGDAAKAALAAVTAAPPDVRLAMRAAQCLVGGDQDGANCDGHLKALIDAATASTASPATVRAALHAAAAMAVDGRTAPLTALSGLASRPAGVRNVAAAALAAAAVRRPDPAIAWLRGLQDTERATAIALLKDGFASLDEDFAEEQFFAAARASYWSAAENSPARALSVTLIQELEF
jgi:HEAT repeat protein